MSGSFRLPTCLWQPGPAQSAATTCYLPTVPEKVAWIHQCKRIVEVPPSAAATRLSHPRLPKFSSHVVALLYSLQRADNDRLSTSLNRNENAASRNSCSHAIPPRVGRRTPGGEDAKALPTEHLPRQASPGSRYCNACVLAPIRPRLHGRPPRSEGSQAAANSKRIRNKREKKKNSRNAKPSPAVPAGFIFLLAATECMMLRPCPALSR